MRQVGIYYAFWTTEWDVDLFPFIRRSKELGFDIAELHAGAITKLSTEERYRLRDEAARCGIELTFGIGLPQEFDVSSLDSTRRENGLRFMETVIRCVSEAGGSLIGGTVHSYWPGRFTGTMDEKEAVFQQSVASVRHLAGVASEYGVRLNVEVLNRFEQFLVNDAREGVRFVSTVDHPSVGLLLDTFHMNIEEDTFRDPILLAGKKLNSFHIGEPNRKPPGMGRMPWGEIKAALDEIGYDGPLVMEPFVIPAGQVGRDIGVWRHIIENPDLDALARQSCEFVKATLA